MASLPLNMEDIDAFLDLESPYMYADEYLDTAASSESTSPVMTTFDLAVLPDFHAVYPSPEGSERESTSPQPISAADDKPAATTLAPKPAAKRKRENRYKNAPPSVLSRRRAQNRASQRAYRERKDQRIKDLETMLEESKQKNETLSQAYSVLHTEFLKLRSTQTRSSHHTAGPTPPHQRHASLGAPYDHQSAIGVGSGMDLVDGLYVFQDMPSYAL